MARGWRKSKKPGTKNKVQAAKRDKAAEERAATDRRAAAETMAAMASPPAAQQPTPATTARDTAKDQMRRQAIVFKYKLMGEPAQEYWPGPCGTLAKIRQWLEMPYTADVRPIAKVIDILRFPVALDAIIAANGAKVDWLDNRRGRRATDGKSRKRPAPYMPPSCPRAEEAQRAKYDRMDPMPR
mmetsp:Transcript_33400/g.107331  ORF Transcript_33400/g.107331 Transcript_33400/m.107331 type:complete len:184 (-) Transcript_33400:146-697(-)|eukprot:CAMPEP_0185310462 /NCGR_PEP_ID=MMETSP1363-20130426/25376_1 /TAXON_ID=38817 /ORGANISM="Gephyrocapsa oceanica, Strain RCC1303" /LENGTH=183 /DNA_ID=CAMNT_0027908035 /DNA_START=173 /DNA_END=724 /DNA_ORIENTATION=+